MRRHLLRTGAATTALLVGGLLAAGPASAVTAEVTGPDTIRWTYGGWNECVHGRASLAAQGYHPKGQCFHPTHGARETIVYTTKKKRYV